MLQDHEYRKGLQKSQRGFCKEARSLPLVSGQNSELAYPAFVLISVRDALEVIVGGLATMQMSSMAGTFQGRSTLM